MKKSAILYSLFAIFTTAALSAELTVKTVTPDGIYTAQPGKGGTYQKPLPERAAIPADAEDMEWDADTLTLSWTLPGSGEQDRLTLTPEEIETAKAHTEPAPVPKRVSKAQLKIALVQAGIDLAALVAQLPAEDQAIAKILIEDADYFPRDAGIVNSLGSLAGLTTAQVDDLFRAAAKINPASL